MKYELRRLPSLHDGYYMVQAPEGYPGIRYDGRYTVEHRAVWWLHHGSLPENGYHIHHINGIPTDNRIENLECIHVSEHVKKRGHIADKAPAEYVELKCTQCQKQFEKLLSSKRYWEKTGQDKFFCNKSCQISYQNQFKKGKKNNYPKNHKQAVAPTLTLSCHACAKEFEITERNYRARTKAGVKKFSCSRSCVNKSSLQVEAYQNFKCQTCGIEFQGESQRRNYYCTAKCRSRAHYLKGCQTQKDCISSE